MPEMEYTLQQAHLHFAKSLNGRVWQLLEAPQRTAREDELMVHAAHAGLYHWLQVGTAVNEQRGAWLLSRVYATLGDGQQALAYAQRCLALTEARLEEMADFDVAYAYEGMVRALVLTGALEQAQAFWQRAERAGTAIADDGDHQIFLGDLGTELAS